MSTHIESVVEMVNPKKLAFNVWEHLLHMCNRSLCHRQQRPFSRSGPSWLHRRFALAEDPLKTAYKSVDQRALQMMRLGRAVRLLTGPHMATHPSLPAHHPLYVQTPAFVSHDGALPALVPSNVSVVALAETKVSPSVFKRCLADSACER